MKRLQEAPLHPPGYSPHPVIHIDANLLVLLMQDYTLSNPVIAFRAKGGRCMASAMAWSEYRCGGQEGMPDEEIRLTRDMLEGVIPVDELIADRAAELFVLGGRRSRSLADCIIAATAILAGAPLATRNREDFLRYEPAGLQLW